MLLRLAYLTVTNAFAALRLLPVGTGMTWRFRPCGIRSPSWSGNSALTR
jgi:hypothetical protein